MFMAFHHVHSITKHHLVPGYVPGIYGIFLFPCIAQTSLPDHHPTLVDVIALALAMLALARVAI